MAGPEKGEPRFASVDEWNYKKQLLRIQVERGAEDGGGARPVGWESLEEDLFSEEFLLTRPLLEAIRASDPVVLLVDEIDRLEIETEALLLEVLSDYQVSIPELGTIRATQIPLVFLTSNNTRELSEALKRRCLFLHLDYPSLERERAIVLAKVPGVTDELADQVARIVRSLRSLDLKKHPSISETIDWARRSCCSGSRPWTPTPRARRCTSCSSTGLTSKSRPRSLPSRPGTDRRHAERSPRPCSTSSPVS